MLFLVHAEVFVSVILDGLFLVVEHGLFHGHELADCVRFEPIKQMLQPVPEVLGIFIDDLRHDLPLPKLLTGNPVFGLRLVVYVFF